MTCFYVHKIISGCQSNELVEGQVTVSANTGPVPGQEHYYTKFSDFFLSSEKISGYLSNELVKGQAIVSANTGPVPGQEHYYLKFYFKINIV